jgi:hypothetical protein
MVLLQSYVFVWSIILEVFCRRSSFKIMSLCGALAQGRHNFEGKPSTEHLRVDAPHKDITLKEDHQQNTSGLMLHTKT